MNIYEYIGVTLDGAMAGIKYYLTIHWMNEWMNTWINK